MVLDVVKVVFELLHRLLDIRAVRVPYLRPSGHTRLDAVAHSVERNLLGQHVDEDGPFRPRSDKAHLSAQHIDQLWQFVDARAAMMRPSA